jgi:hypothetical protein
MGQLRALPEPSQLNCDTSFCQLLQTDRSARQLHPTFCCRMYFIHITFRRFPTPARNAGVPKGCGGRRPARVETQPVSRRASRVAPLAESYLEKTTSPSLTTSSTFRIAPISMVGSPFTTIRSASLPGLSVPST